MNSHAFYTFINTFVFSPINGKVLWPYVAGAVILAVGIAAVYKEIARAKGVDKILLLGPLFFAIAMAVFGSQHFTETRLVATLVPKWIPGHLFFAYLVGTALLAAALAMAAHRQSRIAAFLLAVMLMIFVLTIHIPNLVRFPHNVIVWAIGLRDLAFCGGALALAATEQQRAHAAKTMVTIARIFISLSTIYFGIVHFLHPDFMPGIDFDRSAPVHIPAHVFWSYLSGVIFVLAGMAMLLNQKTRLAATSIGMMALVLVLLVYLPILIGKPQDINDGLNFLVSMLAFSGVAFILSNAVPENGPIARRP